MIGTTVSHYRITAELGAGGMGTVYRADDLKLDRTVALKFLAPELVRDPDAKARFVHEAKAASALDHPNICTIYGIEETEDGRLFIAMACYEGETLKDRIARGPLPFEEAIEITLQVAQGLAKAHGLGIVHRDIKPANVLVTQDGLVKVLDFGIAKLAGATQVTRPGAVLGTMHYLSPELLQGGEVDRRTDLWSLGVVLYELLTGELPFTGEHQQAVMYAILHAEPRSPGSYRDDLPPDLERATLRLLQKSPGERYPSAEALLEVLKPLAAAGNSRLMARGATGQHALADARGVRPYPGLASFTERDAEYFHGRESQVEAVWQKLRHGRLLAVAGPSGVGKTSFLRAGLLPARPQHWGVIVATPGGSPLLSLREALIRELAGDTEAMLALLHESTLDKDVATIRRWRQQHAEALLVLDQFEELFTLSPPAEQAVFADFLSRLILEADVRVLLSLRDDFLYHCQEHPGLAPVVDALTLLGPLTGATLRRALVQPALDCGYQFEDASLIDEMIAAVAGERGALPMLAFTMARLWERRDRDRGLLTRQAYEQIGAVGGALAQHAEAVMDEIGPPQHPVVRELFRNLVTAQGTRAVLDREQLLSVFAEDERPVAERVLAKLIDARLLTSYEVKGEDGAPQRRIEIVHESLLSAWPRLVRWQTQDADSAQLRDQLRQAAQLWEQKGRTDDLLWTGTAYQEFAVWRERYPGGLSESEETFAAAMAARAARGRRRRRLAVSGAFVALVVVLAVVGGFWRQSRLEGQRSEAARMLMLAEKVDVDQDNTVALAVATAALEREDTPLARHLALRALMAAPVRRVLSTPDTMVTYRGGMLDPNGRYLATVNEDGVDIWPADGGEPRLLVCEQPARPFRTWTLHWHPDGQYLAATRTPAGPVDRESERIDYLLTLWSVADGRHLKTWEFPAVRWLIPHVRGNDPYVLVAFGDGSDDDHYRVRRYSLDEHAPVDLGSFAGRAAVPSRSGRHVLWLDGQKIMIASTDSLQIGSQQEVGRHDHEVQLATFGQSEDSVASVDTRGVVRIWSRRHGDSFELVFDRYVDERIDYLCRFDDDRSSLTYRRGNGSRIDILDLTHPDASPIQLLPARTFAGLASFTPDGRWIGSGWVDERIGGGGEYYLYSMSTPCARRYLDLPDPGRMSPEFFMPDGATLVVRRGKRELLTAKVRATNPDVQFLWRNELGDFESASRGPDSRYVCVNNWREKRVVLIPLDGTEPTDLGRPEGIICGTAIEPGGRRVAYSGGQIWPLKMPDKPIIRVHDLQTGEVQVLETEGECGFYGVGFLPDNQLYSCSHEGLLIWDLSTGRHERISDREYPPMVPGNWVIECVLDASQRYLLVNTPEGVTLWDLRDREERILAMPNEGLTCLALAPDLSFVAAGTIMGEILVYRIDTGQQYKLVGHDDTLADLWISPDSKEIRSAGNDGRVLGWDVPTGQPLHTMPHAELVKFLRAQTNMRAVPDVEAPDGYRIEYDPFPGWESIPAWSDLGSDP